MAAAAVSSAPGSYFTVPSTHVYHSFLVRYLPIEPIPHHIITISKLLPSQVNFIKTLAIV